MQGLLLLGVLLVVVVLRPGGGRSGVVWQGPNRRNIHPKSASPGLMGKLFMNYLQCT